jgi:hypothetical protein
MALAVDIHPWSKGDLPLLERLTGDPAMTASLGGPESPEKIRDRHERYCRGSEAGRMCAIAVGPDVIGAGRDTY